MSIIYATKVAITMPYGVNGHRRRIVLTLDTAGNCQQATQDDYFKVFCHIEIPTTAKEFEFWRRFSLRRNDN